MRVLICGGRDFTDRDFLESILDLYHNKFKFKTLIQGGANGADYLARLWATMNEVECLQFDAHWDVHGRGAGSIRNRLMLEDGQPDFVIAFPGHTGTANMIEQARRNKTPVLEIIFPKDRT
jgi:YspA, cpYpsA-related SLOG family